MQYPQNVYSNIPYSLSSTTNDSKTMPSKMNKVDPMMSMQSSVQSTLQPSQSIQSITQSLSVGSTNANQQDMGSKLPFIPSIAADKNGNILPNA